jgi:hypothetical protein
MKKNLSLLLRTVVIFSLLACVIVLLRYARVAYQQGESLTPGKSNMATLRKMIGDKTATAPKLPLASGEIITQDRNVKPFTALYINGNYVIDVTLRDKAKLSIAANEDFLSTIFSVVFKNALFIATHSDMKVTPTQEPQIMVQAKKLTKIVVAGDNNMMVKNISGDNLELDASGAGKCVLVGKVANLTMRAADSMQIDASYLVADNVTIKTASSADIMINARKNLNVNISGKGDVNYSGKSVKIVQDVTGKGRLVKVST